MPQYPLPSHALAQIADLLGVDEDALLALKRQSDHSHNDATLVALTVAEAARRIGMGRTKLYEYVSTGEIASVKIGRLRRIPAEAVADFVARRSSRADFDTAA